MKRLFEQVKKYIVVNNIEKAISLLNNEVVFDKNDEIGLTVLEQNFFRAKDNLRKALLSREDYISTIGKISVSLLEFAQVSDSKYLDRINNEINESGYIFQDFYIGKNKIGIFNPYLSIYDLFTFLPKKQIKKTIVLGHFVEDLFDAYEIYDYNGELLLTIFGEEKLGLNAKLRNILIHSKKFSDIFKKIYMGSTLGKFVELYDVKNWSPDIFSIIATIEDLSLNISFSKKHLENIEWWSEGGSRIIDENIPMDLEIESLSIHWKSNNL